VRYHYTSIRMAKIWNTENTKCWQGCGSAGTLIHWWQEWKCYLEDGCFLTKTKHTLTILFVIVLLGIYPKDLKTYLQTKTCTQTFMAVLFIIAKTCKQLRCSSVREWVNRLWFIHMDGMEYDSVLERNDLSSHEKT